MTSYDLVTDVTEADAEELWPVYVAIFGQPRDYGEWRSEVWDRHVCRSGFRLARAYDDDPSAGRRLVGFGYGYTGERRQWWTDQAISVLDPAVAGAWLGGHFEVVSVGVLEEARGRGHGTGLMRVLTGDLSHERWVLMTTADVDDPARQLYAREGWQVIGPGLRHGQIIMGRRRI